MVESVKNASIFNSNSGLRRKYNSEELILKIKHNQTELTKTFLTSLHGRL